MIRPALVLSLLCALSSTPRAEVPAARPATAPPEVRPLRVAVYQLQGKGVAPRVSAVVTDNLIAELRKLERVAAIGMNEVKDMLTHEESKRLLGCNDDSCMAEIAGALGVDELLTGSLSSVADSSLLTVRRIKLRTAQVAGAINRSLAPGDGEEFLASIGPAVEALYPEQPLRPGLERGVSEEVALALNPPPLPTWVFWTTTGLAAALGATAGGLAIAQQQEVRDYNDKVDGTLAGHPVSGQQLQEIEARADDLFEAAVGVGAAAGALAVGAILVALFTDWWGYGDAPVAAAPLVGSRSAGGLVTINLP